MTEPTINFNKVFQNTSEQFVLETADLPQVTFPNIRATLAVTKVKLVFSDGVYQTCTMTGYTIGSGGGLGAIREAPYPSIMALPDWLAPFTDIATVRSMTLATPAMEAGA